MDDNGKKKLLHEPNFLDAAFVGLCSTGLMAYSLYHHVHDRNTTAWKTSPYLFPVLIAVFGVLLAASLCADALRGARAAETADAAKQKMKMRGIYRHFCRLLRPAAGRPLYPGDDPVSCKFVLCFR